MTMLWALAAGAALAQQTHAVVLQDEQGAPFQCATLQTTNHVVFRTDATGTAALAEPGLQGEVVWLTPAGPLDPPVDGLGIAGFAVTLAPGQTTTRTLHRTGPDPACPRGDVEQRLFAHGLPAPAELHDLQVVDAATGRPVPAVRLTESGVDHWTDNGGHVAFFDLDRMGETLRFEVWTHGYTHDPGYVDVVPTPGGTTVIALERQLPAERLVRLTGGGTWRDTVLLGLTPPVAEPLLDSRVFGQDTAHAVPWRGGLFWLWGDTNRPAYPLGNFRTTGATAPLDPTPEDGLDLDYDEDGAGFVAPIAPVYPEGPTWMSGLVALSDDELWGTYAVVDGTFATHHEGMARWSDARQAFVTASDWDLDAPVRPSSPAIRYDGPDGDWVVYRGLQRIPADPASLADPATYQAYTPLVPSGSAYTVARDADGTPIWRWRTDAPAPDLQLVTDGYLPEADSPWHRAIEPDTGETPVMHNGSIAWNPWRGRWVHVFTESFGSTSLIGEIWYAEGDTPVGPWSWARKVVTHDDYSFYNVYQHPWFASRGGRRILFEGTYTAWLGTDVLTPRHDYNQFFYGLDLDTEPMALPVPFYDTPDGPRSRRAVTDDARVLFGAQEAPSAGRVAVRWDAPACDPERRLVVDGAGETAFYALPAGTASPGVADLVRTDAGAYRLGGNGEPIAAVWLPRWDPAVPLSLYPAPEAADAGPDQCGATSPVALDGSASHLADGIATYTWRWDGGEAQGPTPELALAPGLHVVTLTVSGPSGDAEDVVVVAVADPPDTAPDDTATDTGTPAPDEGDKPAPEGCGCGTAPAPAWLWLAALLLPVVRRR
ncbi:MAG: hypothetical protein R3F59_36965 [Myxococcota bacterium]